MKKCLVLITEDDTEDAEFMKQALRENAFNGDIEHLTNGVQLMNKLSQMKNSNMLPEMIILDLNMPLKNGIEVLNDMNNDIAYKNIPVVVVTASLKKEDEINCNKLGCDLYIKKPVRFTEYNDIASRVLSRMKARFPYCEN